MKTLFISSVMFSIADNARFGANAAGATPCAPSTTPTASAPFDQQVDVTGTVKAFTLTPIGEIEGVILANGTEIHVPPHLTEQVASAVRLGEAVAARGWNTGMPNFIVATALTGQRGQSVVDQGPPPPGLRPPPPPPGQAAPGAQIATVQGRISQILHGPRSDANGALLDDGTTLKFSAANGVADSLLVAARANRRRTGLDSFQQLRSRFRRPIDLVRKTGCHCSGSCFRRRLPHRPAWRRRHHRPRRRAAEPCQSSREGDRQCIGSNRIVCRRRKALSKASSSIGMAKSTACF